MNPWMLAALLAGAIGVGMIASNAAAQATNALPRVTGFAMVDIPTPGLNGQWDLWVTALDGIGGNAMLARIPGHQMIYIPAAVAQAQSTAVDFRYTFTPRGSTTPWTILIPAAIMKAYAALPKSDIIRRAYAAVSARHDLLDGGQIQMVQQGGGCSPTIVQQAINDATYLITGSGSSSLGTIQGGKFDDASDKVSWLTNNAGLIAAVVNEVVTAITCATGGDQATLSTLQSTIEGFALKAGVHALGDIIHGLTSDGGGGGGSTDQPQQDVPSTDTGSSDVAYDFPADTSN